MRRKEFVSQDHARATQGRTMRQGTRGDRIAGIISGTFFGLAVVASISMVALAVIFAFFNVLGTSMMATFNPHYHTLGGSRGGGNTDAVIVNRFNRSPSRGDIIVTRFYNSRGGQISSDGEPFDLFIKRAIGLPGELVFFDRVPLAPEDMIAGHTHIYQIMIDGEPLEEWWMADNTEWGLNFSFSELHRQLTSLSGFGDIPQRFLERVERDGEAPRWEIRIPSAARGDERDYIFYLGDNRGGPAGIPISNDSANLGPQPMEHIVGIVVDTVREMSFFEYVGHMLIRAVTFRWVWDR